MIFCFLAVASATTVREFVSVSKFVRYVSPNAIVLFKEVMVDSKELVSCVVPVVVPKAFIDVTTDSSDVSVAFCSSSVSL